MSLKQGIDLALDKLFKASVEEPEQLEKFQKPLPQIKLPSQLSATPTATPTAPAAVAPIVAPQAPQPITKPTGALPQIKLPPELQFKPSKID